MAEGTSSPIPSERHRSDEASRGERSTGPREGGFRIRLSDNEMRSARALQEAFGLRSTVAVLGFALRALGQQLEEGKLEELVAQHRAQSPVRGPGPGSGSRPEGRRERPEGRGGAAGGGRWQEGRGSGGRGGRVDPFARPARPTPQEAETAEASPEEVLPPPALEMDSAPAPAEETQPLEGEGGDQLPTPAVSEITSTPAVSESTPEPAASESTPEPALSEGSAEPAPEPGDA
ncbi:MAG: hypothetical protein ACK5QW_10195 [Cyanobacteriota bacterium]